jgi:hypothetical protein
MTTNFEFEDSTIEIEESYREVTKKLDIIEPVYKAIIQNLIDSGNKNASDVISTFVHHTIE